LFGIAWFGWHCLSWLAWFGFVSLVLLDFHYLIWLIDLIGLVNIVWLFSIVWFDDTVGFLGIVLLGCH